MDRLRLALIALGTAAAVALIVVVVAGGDDEGSEQGGQATTSAQRSAGTQASPEDSDQQAKGGAQSDDGDVKVDPARSFESFGTEAEGEERDEVVEAMNDYFAALREGIREACPYFSTSSLASIQGLVNVASRDRPRLCAAFARKIGSSGARGLAPEANRVEGAEILRVGIDGDQAIVLLRPEGETFDSYLQMVREGGRWRTESLFITAVPTP